jgi:uncharacterized protein
MATMANQERCTQPPIISERLLRVIVCPVCKGSLILDHETTTLHCSDCKQSYPVRDGIPVLLVREAVRQH